MEGYRHILCATDFSQTSDRAARRAAYLARRDGASLTLLCVIEFFPEDRSVEQVAPEDRDPEQYRRDRARELLAQQAERIGIGEADQEVAESSRSAGYEIPRIAAGRHVDLIVLGSHGHRGLATLLGGTADKVLHGAHCDVLVVRAEE